MLEAALEYAERGWPVFRCVGKMPVDPRWYSVASSNSEEVRAMWAHDAVFNIALFLELAGLMVVDVAAEADLEGLVSLVGPLEETLCSRTPRGGEHLFYRVPDNLVVHSSRNVLAEGVDVYGRFYYVLLPPSRTKHGVYEWKKEIPIAMAPPQLLKAAGAVERSE